MTKRRTKQARPLRDEQRPSDADAFFRDPGDGPAHAPDEVADQLAERFLNAATSGEDTNEARLEEPALEELGGPYVTTTAAEELADDVDPSNPEDAEPAPFPTAQSES